MEVDPDMKAGLDLIQEIANEEFENQVAGLSSETREKYEAIQKAKEILNEAQVPFVMFSLPQEESVHQSNNWGKTLYREDRDGKLYGEKMNAAWIKVSLAFIKFLNPFFPEEKSSLPSMKNLYKWFVYCRSKYEEY